MDRGIAAQYFIPVPDILEPVICSNISKSKGVILTKFLKPAPSSSFKSARRFSPYQVPLLRMCLVHNRTNFSVGAFHLREIHGQ
jgi:hypothetical protein